MESLQLKHYTIKDGKITGSANSANENTISFPDGIIDEDIIRDGAYEVVDGSVQLSEKYLCKRNLDNTDWKMIRHRDQIDLSIETSLSVEEYTELLNKRQTWREKASD